MLMTAMTILFIKLKLCRLILICERHEVDFNTLSLLNEEDLDDLGFTTTESQRFKQGLAALRRYGENYETHYSTRAIEQDYIFWMMTQVDII
jgi:hypothetical protein